MAEAHCAAGRSQREALDLAIFAAEMDDPILTDDLNSDSIGGTDHKASEKCWCQPTLVYTASNGNKVWKHHLRQ